MQKRRLEPEFREDEAPKRGSSRSSVPALAIVNSYLPAIEATPGGIRAHKDADGVPTPGNENNAGTDIAALIARAEQIADAYGRSAQRLPKAANIAAPAVERIPEARPAELRLPPVQNGRVSDTQQKESAALQGARNMIESLDKSVALMKATLAQKEKEVAEVRQALSISNQDKAALRTRLEKTMKDFSDLLQKSADLHAALDERETVLVSTQERVASLEAELNANARDSAGLAQAVEEAKRLYCDELDKRCAQFERQIRQFTTAVAARDERIAQLEAENAKLAARGEELVSAARSQETAQVQARKQLNEQNGSINFLKAMLRVEQEAAEKKLADLIADIERERRERSVAERESAAMRSELVRLLPRLSAVNSVQ